MARRNIVNLVLEVWIQVEILNRLVCLLFILSYLRQLFLDIVAEHCFLKVLVMDVESIVDAAKRINDALAVTLTCFQVRILVVSNYSTE